MQPKIIDTILAGNPITLRVFSIKPHSRLSYALAMSNLIPTKTLLFSRFLYVMKCFKSHNRVLSDKPSRKKRTLSVIDDIRQDFLNFVGNCLGNILQYHIAEPNWPEFSHFRNEANIGKIYVRRIASFVKDVESVI